MTATDELRRMLDERGAEWWQSVNMLGCVFTRWYSPLFSDEVVAMENGDGELELFSHLMTPEQAVEATLGATDLAADNAKLRELVRDMYACIKALCSMVENSPGCSMCLTNQDEEKPCAAADVYCRMRELGVEV